MVQTIGPERRGGERRGPDRRQGERRASRSDAADIDGVVYRLGRLQRVLIDVRDQVRELRAYATVARPEARPDAAVLDTATIDSITRRLEALDAALEGLRDDYELARDAVESHVEADALH